MEVRFGDRVRVGDPCYVPGEVSKSAFAEFLAVEGVWDAYVEDSATKADAVILSARASDVVVSCVTFGLGVDSGQMAFESASVKRGGDFGKPGYYGDACRVTLAELGYGVFRADGKDVFVSSTGHGDGCYTLAVGLNKEGKAVKMEIVFVEGEDVCDWCGESQDWCRCGEDEDEE